MLTVLVFLVLEHLLYGYLFSCLTIPPCVDNAKGPLSRQAMELVPGLASELGIGFSLHNMIVIYFSRLRPIYFFFRILPLIIPPKQLIRLSLHLFDSVGGLRRHQLEPGLPLGRDGFLNIIVTGGIVGHLMMIVILGVDIEEFRFTGGPESLFDLGFVELVRGMLINFGIDPAVDLFSGEVALQLLGDGGLLNSH